jgi:uncharacterized membrane protein
MDKLAMISVLIVTVAAPAAFARMRNPRRGVRAMVLFLLGFNLLYVAYVTQVHTRFFVPKG